LVYDALAGFGAQYLDQLADRAGLSERDTLAALWRLASLGLASNDSFAPLRLLTSESNAVGYLGGTPGANGFTRHDAALRARLKSSLGGRWWAVPQVPGTRDSQQKFDRVREIADLLLERHGVLAREMLALEPFEISWQELRSALRRMEYAGTVRRGWFVRALSGEQYALPQGLEMLRAMRGCNSAEEPPVAFSAADPVNPYGVLLPGCGISRECSNLIVVRGGRMVMGLAARALITREQFNAPAFASSLAALMKLRPKLVIDTVDGLPALESERVGALAAIGFHSDGRALVYDGLPGPAPARAASRAV
jgi:ATP-dependent Lhr-like helicase